jgi:hypothetical protein
LKIHSLVPLLAILLICGAATTARSDTTVYFTAGDGSTSPGVYIMFANIASAHGSLLIPSGGPLSLTDPEGLEFLPNEGTHFTSPFSDSLLVSSSGTNEIVAYDLAGNPEGIFSDEVRSPGKLQTGLFYDPASGYGSYTYAIGSAGVSPRDAVYRLDSEGYVQGQTLGDSSGQTTIWTVASIFDPSKFVGVPDIAATVNGVNGIYRYDDNSAVGSTAPDIGNLPVTPHAVAVGPFGYVYIGFLETVRKFSPSGVLLGTVFTAAPNTGRIQGIGFDPNGKLYVLQDDRLDRVNVAGATPMLEQTNTLQPGVVANSLLMASNTEPGGIVHLADFRVNAAALLKGVKFNAPAHVTPGVTGVVALDADTLHSLPGIPGVTLFDAINVFGSAQFTDSLPIGFEFDPTVIPDGYTESQLHLFAYNPDTGWQDVTGFGNFDQQTIDATANPFGTFAIGAATVPEPTSFVLCGLGAVGLFAFTRRSLQNCGGSAKLYECNGF